MSLLSIIKKSRIERTLPSLALIILAIGITQRTNLEIILFSTVMIFIYAAAGIQNAIKDKEIKIKSKEKIIPITLILIALLISTNSKIIFISALSWIALGINYNNISRKVLLADTTILSITHYFIPITASLILLNNPINNSINIGIIFSTIFFFALPIKNLKGIKEDKKLKYKTLPTHIKKGKNITIISSIFFIILLIIAQILTPVNLILILITFLLYLSGIKLIKENQTKKALNIFRLLFVFSIFTFITTTDYTISIFLSSIMIFIFSLNILKQK